MSHSTYVSKTYMNIWETDGTSVKSKMLKNLWSKLKYKHTSF